jgi:hypothetical protein
MSAKPFTCVLITVVLVGAGSERFAAQGRVAEAKAIRCSFTSQVKGQWRADGSPTPAVGPATLVLRFEGIDTDSGVAQLRNGTVTSEIIVRASAGYLNLLQAFRTGPIYTTTVFDAGSTGGRFKAVHSRHEYFAVPLPGATSTPEQYYGECEITP